MTTMISNLPSGLLMKIFARVPLNFMRAVRLTCKSWNTLFKSESFTKLYIGKTTTRREEESVMIAMMDKDFYLSRVGLDDVNPSIEFKRLPSFLHEQVKISQFFHCEGLLLFILENDDSRVLVLNPYLGQTRWIQNRYSHRPYGLDMFSYALGYENNESCRSVKFLRFLELGYDEPAKHFFWYEIYDFDSGLWKTLDVTPHWFIRCSDHGVSLKGNTYWLAKERNSQNDDDIIDDIVDHIICFDFTREMFGPLLPLPADVRDLEYQYVSLSCVREEKLAVLFQHDETNYYELEIWITTKIDAETVSWSPFLILYTYPDIVTCLCEGFIIDEEKEVVMGFNDDYPKTFSIIGTAGDSRKLELGVSLNRHCMPYVCSYVPSLVRIKELERSKRNRESSLEKIRFDQYKLRLAEFEKERQIMQKRKRDDAPQFY